MKTHRSARRLESTEMPNLIVVNQPKNWPFHIPGVPVVSARDYLTDARFSESRSLKVFNLCKSYRYQSMGYYVSLLATARGHKPLPTVTTIQDLRTPSIARFMAEELEELVERSLKSLRSSEFTLSIYFGHNTAKRYDELSRRLFHMFQAPLLRAEFANDGEFWRLTGIRAISASDIPEAHHRFVIESAQAFFERNRFPARRANRAQFDLAILVDENEDLAPSNKGALRKFADAGKRHRFNVEFIDRSDYDRVAEFDALFIRETTQVNHHTYRFARRAMANHLVAIDDADSIARCTNKVYLTELLNRHRIRIPRTLIAHKNNCERIADEIGYPCILKLPDSAFSQGVYKASTKEELDARLAQIFAKSDLLVAQEFMPTDFDWRIGIIDGQVFFACKYFMAKQHWQIRHDNGGGESYGNVEAVALSDVPRSVLKTASAAAKLIGDSLYGVDLKFVRGQAHVIEVNDNPSMDAGYEDRIIKNELYDTVMRVFADRVKKQKGMAGEGA